MRKAGFETSVPAPAVPLSTPFERGDYLVALFCGLAAFAVYWRTLGPTITGEDSGELVTAAWSLGIAHPPGYPLWCMIGHCFTWLPLGTVAWRVNLVSAVFAAGTVSLVSLLIALLTRNRLSALAGALALAFSLEFWSQAVIAEVYTLNAFFIALCLLLFWRWQATRNDRYLYAFALCYGLSLTNHNTMLLLGPLFMIAAFAADWPRPRWKTYALLTVLALSGTLIYFYLLLRSRANPVADWGNPETLGKLWDHVRRKQYLFLMDANPRSVARFVHQVWAYAGFWLQQFTPGISLFGGLGLAILCRRRWRQGLFLAAVVLVVDTAFILIQNFDFDKEWYCVMGVFAIPAYLVTAVGIGVGLDALSGSRWGRLARPVAALCVCVPLMMFWSANDRSRYYWTEDYARNVLSSLEPNAIYVPAVDHQSFSAVYEQAVEGVRRDVSIGRRYGYVDMGLVPDLPQEERARMGEFPRRREEPEIFQWLLEHSGRPVYFSEPPKIPGITYRHAGLVYRALRSGENAPERDYWSEYRWHTLETRAAHGDNTAELIVVEVKMAKAKDFLADGKTEDALRLIEEAVQFYGPDLILLNNAGVICARAGLYDAARKYFDEALRLDPACEAAATNLRRLKNLG